MDTNAGDYKRKIIAFLGGLDLCDGRYDTPHHPIFSTLETVHKDDYHNPTFAVRSLLLFVFCTLYLTMFSELNYSLLLFLLNMRILYFSVNQNNITALSIQFGCPT